MKRFLALTVVLAAVIGLTQIAFAGPERYSSKEVAPAPVVEPFSWTGFYLGGNLGANWSHYDFSKFEEEADFDLFLRTRTLGDIFSIGSEELQEFSGGNSGPFAPGRNAGTDGGPIGGGQIGFQYQFGHFVLGVEGDFDRTSTERSTTFQNSAQTSFTFEDTDLSFPLDEFENEVLVNNDLTTIRTAQTTWQASARLRAGYASGHTLLYVTGGAAFANVSVTAHDTQKVTASVREELTTDVDPCGEGCVDLTTAESFTAGPFVTTNVSTVSDVLVGWTAGAGAEYALNDMFSIGMEYRHSDFGSHTFHFASHGGPIFPGPMKVDVDNDMVVVKFNVLLNHFFGH